MNCHPRGDNPFQGENFRAHVPAVQRGEDGHGTWQQCKNCHGDENSDVTGVPGDSHWHLAPASMGWDGLSDRELCLALKDVTKNGGRDINALREHFVGNDPLVLWAWDPGVSVTGEPRETPPLSHEEFKQQANLWFDNGALCPPSD